MKATDADLKKPKQWNALWSFYPAFFLAVFVFIPGTIYARRILDLPMPDAIPREFRADPNFTPRYWVIWVISWVILISPALFLCIFHRSRRFGLGYLLTAGTLGAIAAIAVSLFEYQGFAPS